MRRTLRRAWPLSLALLLALVLPIAGCDSDDPDPDPTATADVKVMSYNLYLGGNLFPVTEAPDQQTAILRATELWATVQASRFDLRAQAIADIIEAEAPDLIGLQEVSLYRTQTPSDFVTGTLTPNATGPAIDFLALLMAELDARELDYRVALEEENADVELPTALVPAPTLPSDFLDVRLTDRDVILVRERVTTSDPTVRTFNVQVGIEVPPGSGNTLEFTRSAQWVEATVDDVTFTFANAHLEVEVALPDDAPGQPQEFQATELIASLASETAPVVLVGDFNSPADGTGTDSYQLLTNAYTDTFVEVGVEGGTCCQAPNLRNTTSTLDSRIDLILGRGGVEAQSAEIIGDEPDDRVSVGVDLLWPSDHAGVVATLRIEN
jgi:endonuclease/exonuclease/phosphatase family metal-dependent hydrolase